MKVGGTEASARAAKSHTGAIVGSGKAFEAIFKQKGVILAKDVDDLIDHAMALSMLTLPKGNRLGIMTESGGGGVLLTERASELGLDVSEIHGATREKLEEVVPALGSVQNPVDLVGQSLSDPSLIKRAMDVMLAADDFDIIVLFLLMSKVTARKKALDFVDAVNTYGSDKSVVVCWPEGPKEWIQYLMRKGVYCSVTASRCAGTVAALARYAEFKRHYKESKVMDASAVDLPSDRKKKVTDIIEEAKKRGDQSLNEYEAKEVLRAYGISTVEEAIASSSKEAATIADQIGYPVVAKLLSSDILHKSEAGVIALNIESTEQLGAAYQDVIEKGKSYRPNAKIQGVLIQKMIFQKGVETIIGTTREQPFGPTILFGLGGILVEVMKDVSIKVLPVSIKDIKDMVSEIRGYNILQGVRGRRPSDIESIVTTLVKVAFLAHEFANSIAELDINPLIVLEEGNGVKAVDALILLTD